MVEPLFYRLSELSDRWKRPVRELLLLGIRGQAQICQDIFGLIDESQPRTRIPLDAIELRQMAKWLDVDVNHGARPRDVFACSPDSIRLLEKGLSPGKVVLLEMGDDGNWCKVELDVPHEVRVEDLCMLPVEEQRLDAVMLKAPKPAAEQRTQRRWPWGDYETELLRHLAAAAHEWWADFDPASPAQAPTNEAVSAWLQQRGVSKRNAAVIATILRAEAIQPGRHGE